MTTSGNFECVTIVMLEMGLSFFGIVFNLLVVTTLRQEESIRGSTNNFLLFNLCFSNLVIAFLVKPMSAIYIGYAISSGSWEVGLTFCNLYTIVYNATWCVFPFTLVSMCWIKLLSQCRCTYCGILCCTQSQSENEGSKIFEEEIPYISSSLTSNMVESGESLRGGGRSSSRTLEDGPTVKQKTIISGIWILSFLFGFIFVFQDKILGQKTSRQVTFCKIRTGINDVFDYISLTVTFVLPLIIGPVLIGISQNEENVVTVNLTGQ
ncbi:HRH2 [Lepeophtheirus salmonis]|uniref:HRH2 n=1 Tax=Lepeophtheirus salmonis TaxID=72036 RepID=A0A7R8CXY3_LEPSM|nr:HRH2 [Lepeophtheirus salmonis]CAF2936443.1 HRH2 [Lepeophtheirus salmonis]